MKISSIQVGKPTTYKEVEPDGTERKWRTAIFKNPVEGSVFAGTLGLTGDGQADKRFHGGPDKAINAYCLKHYPHWTAELGLDDMPRGSFGENLTIDEGVEGDVCIGDIFEVGDAVLQISQPRQPCGTLAHRWHRMDLPGRIQKNGMTGWYFRVLKEGELKAGDIFKRIERPFPKWTVALANDIMHHRKNDYAASRELAAVPPLAEDWKESLERRVAGKA